MSDRNNAPITVYYDGACPRCVRERERYDAMMGSQADSVHWFDITDQDERLRAEGIDPRAALLELHVRDSDGRLRREMDAYILLLGKVWYLRPLAWLIGLPGIRQCLSALYRYWVNRRLSRDGRL